jgi:hypothetical protein
MYINGWNVYVIAAIFIFIVDYLVTGVMGAFAFISVNPRLTSFPPLIGH